MSLYCSVFPLSSFLEHWNCNAKDHRSSIITKRRNYINNEAKSLQVTDVVCYRLNVAFHQISECMYVVGSIFDDYWQDELSICNLDGRFITKAKFFGFRRKVYRSFHPERDALGKYSAKERPARHHSSSASRFTASHAGFFILSQSGDLPER